MTRLTEAEFEQLIAESAEEARGGVIVAAVACCAIVAALLLMGFSIGWFARGLWG